MFLHLGQHKYVMTFNVNDNIIAQLATPEGKKISPLFYGEITAINGTLCTIKWVEAVTAARAQNAFSGNVVDMKYLILS